MFRTLFGKSTMRSTSRNSFLVLQFLLHFINVYFILYYNLFVFKQKPKYFNFLHLFFFFFFFFFFFLYNSYISSYNLFFDFCHNYSQLFVCLCLSKMCESLINVYNIIFVQASSFYLCFLSNFITLFLSFALQQHL